MDDTLARILSDIDLSNRLAYWMHNITKWYVAAAESQWGFAIASTIAFIALMLLVLRTIPTVTSALSRFWAASWIGNQFRKFKGRVDMRKRLREQEDRWIADHVVDVLDAGRLNGKIRPARAYKLANKIGRLFGISDLIADWTDEKKQLILKSKLKKKHGATLVILNEERKKRAKPSLKDRIASAAGKKAS